MTTRDDLIAVVNSAIDDYEADAEPYRTMGAAVVDALQIEKLPEYTVTQRTPGQRDAEHRTVHYRITSPVFTIGAVGVQSP